MRCVRAGSEAYALTEPVDQPLVVVGEAVLFAQAHELVDVFSEVEVVAAVGGDNHVPVGVDPGLVMVEAELRNPD